LTLTYSIVECILQTAIRNLSVSGSKMQTWEYLLAADRRADLSDPAAAWAWIQGQPWGASTEERFWTEPARRDWRRNVLVLRSVARRLSRKCPRLLPAEVKEAFRNEDAVAYSYIGMLVKSVLHPDGGPDLLFVDSYSGFRLLPGVFDPRTGRRRSVEGTPEEYCLDDWCVFWQVVFHGLLDDRSPNPAAREGSPAICQTCGTFLGKRTRTGRQKKQQQCGKCRWRKWRRKQSKKKMRSKWREDKQQQKQP
jgi:hypothetical protein